MRVLLIIVFLLANINIFAQTVGKDSFDVDKDVCQMPDTQQVKHYHELLWKIRNQQPALALEYAKRSVEIAEKISDKKWLALSYSYVGVCYRKLGYVAESIDFFNKSIDISTKIGWKNEEAYGYNNLGIVYNLQGNYTEAEEYMKKTLEIAKVEKDSMLLGYAYLTIGDTYIGMHEFERALSNLSMAKEIREKINAPQNAVNAVYVNLGSLYQTINDYKMAKDCFHYILEHFSGTFDMEQGAEVTHHLSQIYYDEKNYDSAFYFAQRALFYCQEVGNKTKIRDAYKVLGNVYYQKHDAQNAAVALAAEMCYNDSISSEGQAQRIYDVQAVMAKYEKEEEINDINRKDNLLMVWLVMATIVLLLTVMFFLRVRKQRKRLVELNTSLVDQNKKITDSINYSQKIQEAVLPNLNGSETSFSDMFVIYKPKDIVSGDFYWQYLRGSYEMIAVADCMGRGVPGAFMSLLGTTALSEIATASDFNAASILNSLHSVLKSMLRSNINDKSNIGMRIALAIVNKDTKVLNFAGANLPAIIVRDGKSKVLPPVRQDIELDSENQTYISQTEQLNLGDCIYLSADGFSLDKSDSQNVGYTSKLEAISANDMRMQKAALEDYYSGNLDDICVIGFRI